MSYIHPRPAPAQQNSIPPWTGNNYVRIARMVQRLHDLGPRPLYEFLTEMAADESVRTDLEINLVRYARHEPSAVPDDLDLKFPSVSVGLEHACGHGRCTCGWLQVGAVLRRAGLAPDQLEGRQQAAR